MPRTLTILAVLAGALALWPAAAGAAPAAGLAVNDELVLFDTASPSTVLERHAITGLATNEHIRDIDVRPANGKLYGLGVTPAGATDALRLYTIDPGTGVASALPVLSPAIMPTVGSFYGFDFNPVADRIRLVTFGDESYRISPDSGLVNVDMPVDDASDANEGSDEGLVSLAYDRNAAGATSTTLWGYDYQKDRIVTIGGHDGVPSPNSGGVFGIGSSGILASSKQIGMDVTPAGDGLLSSNTNGATGIWKLYRFSFGTGVTSEIGTFPERIDDFALLQPSAFQFDSRSVAVSEDAGNATVTVARSGNATSTQTVAYATSDGSANSSDYTPASGTLTFAPGVTAQSFTVPITNDSVDELQPETVNLTLSSPRGAAALGAAAAGTLTIFDDDPTPVPPPPPPPPDTTKPTLLLKAPASISVRKIGRGVSGSFSCSEACGAKLALTLGSTSLGKATGGVTEASVGKFKLPVPARSVTTLRKKLKRHRSVATLLSLTGTDTAGNPRTVRMRVTVTR